MTTTTTNETIEYTVADHVATITLNRPDVYNAFNDQLTTELADALKSAERDKEVRVIILTGAGKAFCSGQDLADLKDRYASGVAPDLSRDIRTRYNPIITRICTMPKPVIAAVNGVAAGAGCSLALACDLRIASEHASFIELFINVGLVPDSGSTYFLPRLIGHARAMELCCTGEKVPAEEALRLGLVNRVVPADQLLDESGKVAGRLASLPGRAIALTKRLMNRSMTSTLAQQLEAEAYAQTTAGQTADHLEGVMAFLEKRRPAFGGE
jgi:2-(1,2-epoxy-1,2-dihydrophenyl)acetyl-CoA isomerase